MTIKFYIELLFLIACTFFTLIVFDLIWGINTGISSYDNCIVVNTNDVKGMSLIDYFWTYALYFLLGILPFGWSFFLYMFLKMKVPLIKNFFSYDGSRKTSNFYDTNIFYIIMALIYIPLPLIIYDFLLC
tara:strand:+ start:370 stop:759 length:390 start_codon:yes stop_codon:yes gene_type:complete